MAEHRNSATVGLRSLCCSRSALGRWFPSSMRLTGWVCLLILACVILMGSTNQRLRPGRAAPIQYTPDG